MIITFDISQILGIIAGGICVLIQIFAFVAVIAVIIKALTQDWNKPWQ